MAAPIETNVLKVPQNFGQIVRKKLEESGFWDNRYRLQRLENGFIAIPVKPTVSKEDIERVLGSFPEMSWNMGVSYLKRSKLSLLQTPRELLILALKQTLSRCDIAWTESMEIDVPSTWEIHGDLALLSDRCFSQDVWSSLGTNLWSMVASSLKVKRVAVKTFISSDQYRTPQVCLKLGENGWVEHIDNKIRYSHNILKCMFSAGNVTEKLRIANFSCEGETVVDLYAGIGYFTLPYLVHAKASKVHACEWNPDAVDALKRNLELNGVSDRCVVYQGDNRQVCPKGIADRVNLGLIPSSEAGWPVACAALKPYSGGVLHIHANVTTKGNKNSHNVTAKENCKEKEEFVEPSIHFSPDSEENIESETSPSKHQQNELRNNVLCSDHEHLVVRTDESDVTHCNASPRSVNKTEQWTRWAENVRCKIQNLLTEVHRGEWITEVLHVEHVKSYAPHIDHMVVDLKCSPC